MDWFISARFSLTLKSVITEITLQNSFDESN